MRNQPVSIKLRKSSEARRAALIWKRLCAVVLVTSILSIGVPVVGQSRVNFSIEGVDESSGHASSNELKYIREQLIMRPENIFSPVVSEALLPSSAPWKRQFFSAQEGSTQPTEDSESQQSQRIVGPVIASVIGGVLFGYFLKRNAGSSGGQVTTRDTKAEMMDYALFAGSVSILGAGLVMLMSDR
jgi:hypothetical protein